MRKQNCNLQINGNNIWYEQMYKLLSLFVTLQLFLTLLLYREIIKVFFRFKINE